MTRWLVILAILFVPAVAQAHPSCCQPQQPAFQPMAPYITQVPVWRREMVPMQVQPYMRQEFRRGILWPLTGWRLRQSYGAIYTPLQQRGAPNVQAPR